MHLPSPSPEKVACDSPFTCWTHNTKRNCVRPGAQSETQNYLGWMINVWSPYVNHWLRQGHVLNWKVPAEGKVIESFCIQNTKNSFQLRRNPSFFPFHSDAVGSFFFFFNDLEDISTTTWTLFFIHSSSSDKTSRSWSTIGLIIRDGLCMHYSITLWKAFQYFDI